MDSSLVFNINKPSDIQVETTTINAFCDKMNIDCINLLKLDIEGSELGVLSDLDADIMQKISQITCEFHDFLDTKHIPKINFPISVI